MMNEEEKNGSEEVINNAANLTQKAGLFAKKTAKAFNLALKGMKTAFVATKAAISAIISILASLSPVVIIALSLVVALVAVGSAFSSVFEGLNSIFDTQDSKIVSNYGISNDCFYGARFVYKDNELACEEIKESYLNYVAVIYKKISESITLTFSIPTDLKSATEPQLLEPVEIMVETVTGNEYNTQTLNDGLMEIDHFGLSAEEQTNVKNNLSTYFKANKTSDNQKIFNSTTSESLANKVDEVFSNYSNNCLNFVSEKLFFEDQFLSAENKSLVAKKKNYVSMTYIPKTNVALSSVEYVFYVDSQTEKVKYTLMNQKDQTQTILSTGEADCTWASEKNGFEKSLSVSNMNLTLPKFSDFDSGYVDLAKTANSLCDVAYYDFFNTTNFFSKYFLTQNNITNYSFNEKSFLCLLFESNVNFAFGEFDIAYKQA